MIHGAAREACRAELECDDAMFEYGRQWERSSIDSVSTQTVQAICNRAKTARSTAWRRAAGQGYEGMRILATVLGDCIKRYGDTEDDSVNERRLYAQTYFSDMFRQRETEWTQRRKMRSKFRIGRR